ncbi:uncharacterized protein EV154DRAFT_523185 [Mucor mucedo]|uniref:uncharacterized protein n=1 Tax=Mucor mucedo TaxID=29922 RepID=UPI00221ED95E|nr:uncharacterized protein EV154DRAFT_523185 [Mucor mucedo]KAI7882137.1 hypothetical protein EV154DRAFT_523185 [Mucor mucedo]
MSSSKLPVEILEKIFRNVKSQDEDQLIHCTLVCKSWHEPALRLYYETLILSGDPRKLLFRLSNQPQGKNLGDWVKQLSAVCDLEHLSQHGYFQLLSYLPHLNVINVEQSFSKSFHLTWLLNRNDDSCVKNLHTIVAGANGMTQYEYRIYFACAYSFRLSLRYLELVYVGGTINNMGGLSGTHVSFLKDFKYLTKLSVSNLSFKRGDRTLKMLSILQYCPRLTSLSFVSDYFDPQEQVPSLNPGFRLALKDVSLCIPNLSRSQINYIASNFPALDKFDVVLTNTETDEWLETNGEACIQLLGEYLGSVREVCFNISRFMPNRYPPLSILTSQTLSNYWPFIFAMIGHHRQLSCHISVRLDERSSYKCSNANNLLIKRNDRSMYLTYILDTTDLISQHYFEIPNSIQSLIPLPSENSSLGNQHIISVEVAVGTPDGLSFVMPISKCFRLLRSIIKEYSRLNLIMFSTYTPHHEMYNLKFGSSIRDCLLSTKQGHEFFKMDPQRYKAVTTPTVENLTHVLLKSTTLEQFDFHVMANLLEYIHYLKIVDCHISTDENGNTTVDLSYMKSLKQLVFDVGFLKHDRCSQINIQVEYLKENFVKSFKWRRAFIRGKESEFSESTSARYHIHKWLHATKNSNTSLLFIKCYNIDQIDICLHKDHVAATFLHPKLSM